MGIALVVTGGIVLVTVFASVFDYLSKKNKGLNKDAIKKVDELEKRLNILESTIEDRNERIEKLESDLSFMTKLIEQKDK